LGEKVIEGTKRVRARPKDVGGTGHLLPRGRVSRLVRLIALNPSPKSQISEKTRGGKSKKSPGRKRWEKDL